MYVLVFNVYRYIYIFIKDLIVFLREWYKELVWKMKIF